MVSPRKMVILQLFPSCTSVGTPPSSGHCSVSARRNHKTLVHKPHKSPSEEKQQTFTKEMDKLHQMAWSSEFDLMHSYVDAARQFITDCSTQKWKGFKEHQCDCREKLCNNRRAQKEVCLSSGKTNIKRTRRSAIKTYWMSHTKHQTITFTMNELAGITPQWLHWLLKMGVDK